MAPYFSLTDQRDLSVPRFPESQSRLGDQIQAILDKHAAYRIQSRTLATLRDALLPKLLSGELSVAEMQGSRGGPENAETNT